MSSPFRETVLPALTLSLALLGGGLAPQGPALAQSGGLEARTILANATRLGASMSAEVRAEVAAALSAMDDAELQLTYARIFALFRDFLGHDDLSVARALIDYAALAQAELERRNLARPEGTESASAMGIAFELIL